MTDRVVLERKMNKKMRMERSCPETPECLLDLWQAPVLSIIPSCSAEEG